MHIRLQRIYIYMQWVLHPFSKLAPLLIFLVTDNEASRNKENEVVIRNGHVSTNEKRKDVRKSDRARKENTK